MLHVYILMKNEETFCALNIFVYGVIEMNIIHSEESLPLLTGKILKVLKFPMKSELYIARLKRGKDA